MVSRPTSRAVGNPPVGPQGRVSRSRAPFATGTPTLPPPADTVDSSARGGRSLLLVTLMTGTLLPIGRFARLTELTVKALRHYAEIGLLEPARVDEATGYRFYALEQAGRADAIRRLRGLELPLEDVRRVLDGDESVLAGHRDRLVERIGALSAHVAGLGRLIHGEEEPCPRRRRCRCASSCTSRTSARCGCSPCRARRGSRTSRPRSSRG